MKSKQVCTVKEADNNTAFPKARLFIQGFSDTEKGRLIHTSNTERIPSVRLFVSIARITDMKLWGLDITQAYRQSDAGLAPDVNIHTLAELGIHNNILLRKVEALYGLTEARN